MIPDSPAIIITCEHAGNLVPARYRNLFKDHEKLLKTHRGYDIGALSLARGIAKTLDAPLFYTKYTRLLVEANRSLHHRNLFSDITRSLDAKTRQHIINTYYLPYRNRIEEHMRDLVDSQKQVVHLSIHTFTPVLDGQERSADIGLLYDPQRSMEKTVSSRLINTFKTQSLPGLKYRRNYPYKGIADGLTAGLRKQFADQQYAGLEIEVNQKYFFHQAPIRQTICNHITAVIRNAIGNPQGKSLSVHFA